VKIFPQKNFALKVGLGAGGAPGDTDSLGTKNPKLLRLGTSPPFLPRKNSKHTDIPSFGEKMRKS